MLLSQVSSMLIIYTSYFTFPDVINKY